MGGPQSGCWLCLFAPPSWFAKSICELWPRIRALSRAPPLVPNNTPLTSLMFSLPPPFNPNLSPSSPFYTLSLMGPSSWQNLLHMRGPYQIEGSSDFLSLWHYSSIKFGICNESHQFDYVRPLRNLCSIPIGSSVVHGRLVEN